MSKLMADLVEFKRRGAAIGDPDARVGNVVQLEDSTGTAYDAGNPMPVTPAGGGSPEHWEDTPTISAAAIYAAGDALGGKSEVDVGVAQFVITKVVIVDNDKENASIDIVFFVTDFTATADNAAFDPSDADLQGVAGHISVTSGNYSSFNDNSIATVVDQPLDVELRVDTTLRWQCVVRGTPTYTATDDITVMLTIRG